jgi:poly(3-hydroxybutyrate) depolymerase
VSSQDAPGKRLFLSCARKQPLSNSLEIEMRFSVLVTVCAMSVLYAVCLYGESNGAKKSGPSYIEVIDARGYKALVLVPTNTAEAANGKLPTILFLHGIGESGNDLNVLRRNGFPRNLEGDQAFPFIFIMPQCPSSTEWYYTNADNVTAMRMFLDDLIVRFPIDTNRIYITGLSMGGIGSWYFAIKMPTRFAALVPVSFRGDGWSPAPAVNVPVWAFHGAKDGVIPIDKAQVLVDQFSAIGGSIRFTVYPNGSHDGSTWTVTYNNPDVYDWMLRKKRPAPATGVENPEGIIPGGFLLEQNFPNPFNPVTTISFTLPGEMHANLAVSNIYGQTVAVLLNEHRAAGSHRVEFDASNLPSGTYFCRLSVGEAVRATKMLLVK